MGRERALMVQPRQRDSQSDAELAKLSERTQRQEANPEQVVRNEEGVVLLRGRRGDGFPGGQR